MAKANKINRTQLDRYRPTRMLGMQETVSFSDRGSLAISADLMADWPNEQQYVVIYATPKTRAEMFLEPAGPDALGSLKIRRDTNGSAKANGKAAIHQFGLDDVEGVRRCPARWVDGMVVAGVAEAAIIPRGKRVAKPEKAANNGEDAPARKGPRGWVGKMKCSECMKEVAYRIIDGARVTRGHMDPDGLPCGGPVDADD